MEQLDVIREDLRRFAAERDWEPFHTPRNLALALVGEVGELAALMQWVPSEDMPGWLSDPDNAVALRHEIADVFAYLLQFADSAGVDPVAALAEKIELNSQRYPVEKSRGSSAKYTVLDASSEETE